MIDVISLALSKKYTDKEIIKAAASLNFKQKIVESLPSSGEIHTIYFVKNNSSWKDNYYDEYLWIPDTNSFEKIGSTEIPDTSDKMDKNNPTGTGSFSLNRKSGSTVGNYSHAEGFGTTASGDYSHAEGANTTASGTNSHAEGYIATASGLGSHAEGYSVTASGKYSHVEGSNTVASAYYAHAEGVGTTASGWDSHAEGANTTASGTNSHAEGSGTKASSSDQHVQGKHNIEDSSNIYADIIGNGNSSTPSNAATVDWHGNAWFAGDVYVGSTSGTNKDEGSKKLATEEYVDTAQPLFIDFYGTQDKIVTDSTITLEEMKEIIQKRIVYCRYGDYVLTLGFASNLIIGFMHYDVADPHNPSDGFTWCDFRLTKNGWNCKLQEL